jgi:hypothetical protein
MGMKEILDAVVALEKELRLNTSIEVSAFEFFNSPANSRQIEEFEKNGKIEKTVLDFYGVSDGFEIGWQPVDTALKAHDIAGRVKVNPFQRVMRNWSGVVYFDDEPQNSARRKFFPLDFFVDEAAAGFCTLEGYRDMIYLFKFEGDLIPLDVDFEGYLRCMLMARGCVYWQHLLLELTSGQENEVSRRIKAFLPRLFPDFDFQAFAGVFNEVRVPNR